VTGTSVVALSSEQFDSTPASYLTATFSPGLDYFVLPNLSIGVTADVAYTKDKGYDASGNFFASSATSISAAPRLGFNLPLGDYVSWYPRAAFGIVTERSSTQIVTPTTNPGGAPFVPSTGSASGAWVNVFAPLLVHPVPHFFVGVGPRFTHDFTHLEGTDAVAGRPTTLDGEFVLGGWWGGTPDAARTAEAPERRALARRFGTASEWVFTGESAITVASTRYGVQGSSSSVSVAPGFDYFVADDFSMGANAYVNSAKSSGTDDTGTPYASSGASYGLAVHLGVNVPLGSALSLYPRGYFGFGGGSYNDTSGTSSNQASYTNGWVSLYVPLLVHPAPHVFVGFGPSATHQLLAQYSYPNGAQFSNLGTTVGAGLIVGGWL